MKDYEKYIEDCYLGKISIPILKERIGSKDIDEYSFAKQLLKIAKDLKNSDAIHVAFLIFDEYELKEEDFDLLDIFFSHWHDAHEDIAFTVSKIKNCNLVDFFDKAINFIPNYMVDDSARGLARKVFFGLGENISCPNSLECLIKYSTSSDGVLKGFAQEQFQIYGK
ncbi:hypothetical protein AXE41_RS01440 [Acinetobacter baumannii]|jgi:hypothetical protein|uniref:Uncharacterized protein n=1 Tax=Acinetobacter baumannii TaxID=470 RepID=A0AAQ1ARW5_ACIBA|nr:hypothetical protein [Acinetobacter baumannii]EHU1921695.1 hypothetical protein [Acinetobacter baumannii]EHU1986516.1 hypothetical protein [Acinetobacter baumannii]EHU2638301.1 hypothetical protein [Acinetobacter baumannii]EHU3100239.1 hypothetical protein [Acinetobacter baumannii]EHU3109948.1 hypothetical protein [Acinetobacter baumannii]